MSVLVIPKRPRRRVTGEPATAVVRAVHIAGMSDPPERPEPPRAPRRVPGEPRRRLTLEEVRQAADRAERTSERATVQPA
jgi:hypothetical protein